MTLSKLSLCLPLSWSLNQQNKDVTKLNTLLIHMCDDDDNKYDDYDDDGGDGGRSGGDNRELKQRHRRRQRARQKSKGLDWQNNNSTRASRFFVHFFVVTARATTWKYLTSRFVEDVNTRQWLSFSPPELWYSLLEFNSRENCQHLMN